MVDKSIPWHASSSLVHQLIEEYKTPLYVIHEQSFVQRIREYKKATSKSYKGESQIAYASKANSTLAVLSIASKQEQLLIDCASLGELEAALHAGATPSQCYLHGSNKSDSYLRRGIASNVAFIVIDDVSEIEAIAEISSSLSLLNPVEVLIRIVQSVAADTHAKIDTTKASKFGIDLNNAERATLHARKKGLEVIGYHSHVGSQLCSVDAQRDAALGLAKFAVQMLQKHNVRSRILNVGGGLGIHYKKQDQPLSITSYCETISQSVTPILSEAFGDDLPKLMHEPGRSLIGECGITLYTVGVVKKTEITVFVNVDGGLSDNPRPALYDAAYTVRCVPRAAESSDTLPKLAPFTVCGTHCETDVLFVCALREDVQKGDILQVLCTGAFNSSMASNYNCTPRPATVLVRSKDALFLAQRREEIRELFARDQLLYV